VSHLQKEVMQISNRIFIKFIEGVIEELPVYEDDDFKEFLKAAF
jgi:hypothetical protein